MTNVNVNQGDGTVGGNVFPSDPTSGSVAPASTGKNLPPVTDQLTQVSQEGLQNKSAIFSTPALPVLSSELISSSATNYNDVVAGAVQYFSSPEGQAFAMEGVKGGYSEMSYEEFLRILQEVLLAMREEMAKQGIVPDAVDSKYLRSVIETWLGAKMPFYALHPRIYEMSSAKNELGNIKDKMQNGGQVSLANVLKLQEQLKHLGLSSPSGDANVSKEDLNHMMTSLDRAIHKELRDSLGILGEPVRELLTLNHLDPSRQLPTEDMTHSATEDFVEVMKPAEDLVKKLINGDVPELIKGSTLSPSEQKILQDLIRGVVMMTVFEQAVEGKATGQEKKDPTSLVNQETLKKLVKGLVDPETEDSAKLLRLLLQLLQKEKIADELMEASSKVAEGLGITKDTHKIMYDNLSI